MRITKDPFFGYRQNKENKKQGLNKQKIMVRDCGTQREQNKQKSSKWLTKKKSINSEQKNY